MNPDHQQSIAIAVLQKAREEKRAHARALEKEIEDLDRAIQQLQAAANAEAAQYGGMPINEEIVAEIVRHQEQAIEDNNKYPAEKFIGMSRVEIAIALALEFDGFLATSVYRKALSKPGVLKSTSQVGSVASRILAKGENFYRVWEGLYRLKDYET